MAHPGAAEHNQRQELKSRHLQVNMTNREGWVKPRHGQNLPQEKVTCKCHIIVALDPPNNEQCVTKSQPQWERPDWERSKPGDPADRSGEDGQATGGHPKGRPVEEPNQRANHPQEMWWWASRDRPGVTASRESHGQRCQVMGTDPSPASPR